MAKQSIGNKAVDGFYKLKSYWHKAQPGYEVSYKEITNFTVGFGSIGISSVLMQWTSLAISMPLLLNYFKASTGVVFILTMIGALIGLLRAPILSMIIDNSNSSKGKFKPFLIWTCIIFSVCFMLVPFIPQSWNAINVFSFGMPAMPLFGITESSTISMSVGLLTMFLLTQVGTFVHTLFNQCMTGIENTVTSVAQERSNIVAIKNLISNLPNSLVNIIMPIFAAMLFTNGMNDVRVYRIFFPIVAVIAVLCAIVMYKGTTERVVINKKHKNKVSFWKGAKELSKSKHFWIITIFSVFSGIRGGANIYMWVCNYSIGGQAGAVILSICNMVLNNAFIPGLLLAPMLIKKFGKTKVIGVSNIAFAVMVALQLGFIQAGKAGSFLILFGVFFQNLALSVGFVSSIMVSDVLDYQQYKTNKRLEGFWHNYSNFILTFAGVFTAILSPLFLSFGGISFGESIDGAMQDMVKREGAYTMSTYLALIGGVLSIIPMLFYDLSEYKHRNIVRALRVRKAVENYEDNTLEDSDLMSLREVLNYLEGLNDQVDNTGISKSRAKELKSAHFITDEIAKYREGIIDDIMTNYDECKERVEKMDAQDRLKNLKRNIELEEKILALKVARESSKIANLNAKREKKVAAQNKKNIKMANSVVEFIPQVFNEEEFIAELVAASRFMKDKDQLSELMSIEEVVSVDESGDALPVDDNDVEITISGVDNNTSNEDESDRT